MFAFRSFKQFSSILGISKKIKNTIKQRPFVLLLGSFIAINAHLYHKKVYNYLGINFNQTVYDDDEPLQDVYLVPLEPNIPQQQVASIDLSQFLKFEIKPIQGNFQLSPINPQTITAVASLELDESKVQTRAPIDLVCVLDRSGSMFGEKIALVKDTLDYLTNNILTERDRVCFIEFNQSSKKLTPLLRVSQQNKPFLNKVIEQIDADGGTDIASGCYDAFKTLKHRKYRNSMASVFLLSDGLDEGALQKIQKNLSDLQLTDFFTMHTFGYGSDHDPELMNNISKLREGNYYSIDNFEQIDQCFLDALAGAFSVVAQNILFALRINTDNPYFMNAQITKTWGNQWQFQQDTGKHQVFLKQYIAGVRKGFVFDILIPPTNQQVFDYERSQILLSADLTADSVGANNFVKSQNINLTADLRLNLFNANEQMPLLPNDQQAQQDLMRMISAEALQNAIKYADNGNFQQGQQQLDQAIQQINNSHLGALLGTAVVLAALYQAKKWCDKKNYSTGGRAQMMSSCREHMEQRSMNVKTPHYQNRLQKNYIKRAVGRPRKYFSSARSSSRLRSPIKSSPSRNPPPPKSNASSSQKKGWFSNSSSSSSSSSRSSSSRSSSSSGGGGRSFSRRRK